MHRWGRIGWRLGLIAGDGVCVEYIALGASCDLESCPWVEVISGECRFRWLVMLDYGGFKCTLD